jgi:hypothetical protein
VLVVERTVAMSGHMNIETFPCQGVPHVIEPLFAGAHHKERRYS